MTTPAHVAIIMDGNGRWAKARGLPRLAGHRAGVEALRRTVRAVGDAGVRWLTVYAFSSENWNRPKAEVSDLMGLLKIYIRRDLADRQGYLNARNTLRDLIEAGTVPIVNENDAVALDQVLAARIGENDTLSALVANLIDADALVLLTDVDGLYDADPHSNPDAKLLSRIERVDASVEAVAGGARGPGTGGMATKLNAARIATQGGVDVVIASGRHPNILGEIAQGTAHGTLIPAAADRLESRKRWILGNVSRGGHIVVDDGAVAALREKGRSLLPAGVRDIAGEFDRGDAVEVRDGAGGRVAAGTVNYGSDELARIRGIKSARIAEVLGYAFGDEVIHRDNMVVL